MKHISIPPSMSGPQGPRRQLRAPVQAGEGGHFLSIIGFDGKMTMHTFNRCMAAQGKISQLWRGWYNHGHEGQIRARNECAYQFLKTPCSHHLLLDSDIVFEPEHILSLRKHPEAQDSIICGAYCKKSNRVEICYNSLKGGNPEPNKALLMEVATAGTGFMQIPRSAYLKIQRKFPKRWYSCDYKIHADGSREQKYSYYFQDVFFDENSGLWRDMTEDWAFCWMAREAGVKIYLDLGTAQNNWVGHVGNAMFPLEVEKERIELEDKLKIAQARIVELEAAAAPAAKGV